ncbi:MAG: nucleoside triphosphate pyrophosphohydrolase [Deltaproteobacteria bacterium]|nr:MAG: nucleoside triphosphate pyrophosphohydrolase [Deltaproteobacteria bacterium]
MTLAARLQALLDLIKTLRGEHGCPWDRRQTPASMGRYLAEEVFELIEAIEKDDAAAVAEELGDVLFQAFFIAELYRETGRLNLEAVLAQIHAKMVRRHPHVFGDAAAETTEAVRTQWEQIKRAERGAAAPGSALDGVPAGMPALLRAWRISQRAIGVGFDWPDLEAVIHQAEDEWREFREELARPDAEADGRRRIAMEFGDLLFTLVNVARFARIHPETALTAAIGKFEARFRHMERAAAAAGKDLVDVPREEMERLWDAAKNRLADEKQ